MAAFDDGTPLDAAALQDLDRRLVEIKASIPRIGDSTSTESGVQNSTVNAKQILGGLSDFVTLSPGKNSPFTIKFSDVQSTPRSVVVTPARGSEIPSTFSFVVDQTTLEAGGVKGWAYLNSSAKGSFKLKFYWMVICY